MGADDGVDEPSFSGHGVRALDLLAAMMHLLWGLGGNDLQPSVLPSKGSTWEKG
jgi:hypothetical protein